MIETEQAVEQVVEPVEAGPAIPLHRWFMAASILLLNLFDVIITKAILRSGGSEANPIMAPIIDHPAYPIVLKTVIAMGVGALLLASPRSSKLADRSVFVVIVAYTLVTIWNVGILLRASGVHGLG